MPEPDVSELLSGRAAVPIVSAPMAGGPSGPALVAAVARAGALGFLAAGYRSAEGMAAEVAATRGLTDAPFGVNVFVPGPSEVDEPALATYLDELIPDAERLGVRVGVPRRDDDGYAAKLEVLGADPVAVVSFTFGAPDASTVRRLHAVGTRVVVTVTGPDEAALAAAAGADALCVQGSEAGGHHSRFRNDDAALSPLPLLDALAAVGGATTLPMLAAGGIATGRRMAAVLDAGAVAVQIGTAFLAATEAGTNATHRGALTDPGFTGTMLTRAFTGRPARGIRNRFMVDHPTAPAAYPQIHHATRALRAAAAERGIAEALHLWAGVEYKRARAEPAGVILGQLLEEWRATRSPSTGADR
ncbi:MAG TPA: nitronate monooxygenase [Acidimicrobiales bacterium]